MAGRLKTRSAFQTASAPPVVKYRRPRTLTGAIPTHAAKPFSDGPLTPTC
ncbi:hypothetical protein [Neisseria elongata]